MSLNRHGPAAKPGDLYARGARVVVPDRLVDALEADAARLADQVELVRDRELEVAPGVCHQLRELRLEGRELHDLRRQGAEHLGGGVEALVVEGRHDLGQRVDLVEGVALGHALGAERDAQARVRARDPLVEVLHRAREQRRAHHDQLAGMEVRRVEIEDAQHLGELRVEVLVHRRPGHEDDDVGGGARLGAGGGLQVQGERRLQLLVAALLDEREAPAVDALDGRLVDVDEARRGAGQRELHAEREPHVPAAADDGDRSSLQAMARGHDSS